MSEQPDFLLFALDSTRELGEKIAKNLGITLSPHEERNFEDGEHKTRPLINIRNKDVFVIESLYTDTEWSVNDKLCRLLFFISTLRDASAARITAVIPYLCYARKDRQTKARDPIITRYIANLFEASGVDHFVTIDVHNLQAYQNAFQCDTDHLEAKNLFIDYFIKNLGQDNLVVMSPDIGGVKRAEQFCQDLGKKLNRDIPLVFMEKYRSHDVVRGETVVGDVENKNVIIIDDLISSGTTLARSAKACQKLKAKKIYAAATHGLFVANANEILREQALTKVIVTNTIGRFHLIKKNIKDKLDVIDIAPLFAEAIKRIHNGGSIAELLEMEL